MNVQPWKWSFLEQLWIKHGPNCIVETVTFYWDQEYDKIIINERNILKLQLLEKIADGKYSVKNMGTGAIYEVCDAPFGHWRISE